MALIILPDCEAGHWGDLQELVEPAACLAAQLLGELVLREPPEFPHPLRPKCLAQFRSKLAAEIAHLSDLRLFSSIFHVSC